MLAGRPFRPVLTSVVVPVERSRTKTSRRPLVSPGTRFALADVKTTRPVALHCGRPNAAVSSALAPDAVTLMSSVGGWAP